MNTIFDHFSVFSGNRSLPQFHHFSRNTDCLFYLLSDLTQNPELVNTSKLNLLEGYFYFQLYYSTPLESLSLFYPFYTISVFQKCLSKPDIKEKLSLKFFLNSLDSKKVAKIMLGVFHIGHILLLDLISNIITWYTDINNKNHGKINSLLLLIVGRKHLVFHQRHWPLSFSFCSACVWLCVNVMPVSQHGLQCSLLLQETEVVTLKISARIHQWTYPFLGFSFLWVFDDQISLHARCRCIKSFCFHII